jgi:NAD-dependent dihydropyrimidine dehydrogenase PreA subunit
MPHRFDKMTIEVEQGFTPEQTRIEVERCLNCDVRRTSPTRSASSATRASTSARPTASRSRRTATRRICPGAHGAAHGSEPAALRVERLKQTGRVMVKDENVCVHCGLCAERCPTYAWDMRKFIVQIPMAEQQRNRAGGCIARH